MSEQSKCPFTGVGTPPKHPTGRVLQIETGGQTV